MQDQAIDAQSECVQDGDTIILRGFCAAAGARRIGFGECRGTVLPAVVCPQA
jgi:fumarylacetoacetase